MKRLLSVLLALALTAGLAVTAFAAQETVAVASADLRATIVLPRGASAPQKNAAAVLKRT